MASLLVQHKLGKPSYQVRQLPLFVFWCSSLCP